MRLGISVDNQKLRHPSIERKIKTRVDQVRVWLRNWKAFCLDFLSSWEKTGINAEVRAPSPRRRRNKFGSVNAKMNAELMIPTPRIENVAMSLQRPRMRDSRVIKLTVKMFRKVFFMSYFEIMILLSCNSSVFKVFHVFSKFLLTFGRKIEMKSVTLLFSQYFTKGIGAELI